MTSRPISNTSSSSGDSHKPESDVAPSHAKARKPRPSPKWLRDNPYVGKIFRTTKDARWRILAPLSTLEFQDDHSPCEARQVYTCVCLDEPWKAIGECVVKVKFQIRASRRTVEEYQEMIDDGEAELRDQNDTRGTRLPAYKDHLKLCTTPTTSLSSPATRNEIEALDHLGHGKCQHSPWLCGTSEGTVRPGFHYEAIDGGYRVLMLMNKLPGVTLSMEMFCEMAPEKRKVVREAFKVAWLAVVKCGVVPIDRGLHNIMWDQETCKCYLLDFEEVDKLRANEMSAPSLEDDELDMWIPNEDEVAEYLAY
ncbi:uncharacterized protein J4E87_010338 [Alternaria ethzedia]|uniref:uncharacterized protein n=1 Tax=Alternaria ethzedia TaxID=181014 RepID=UPI0020C26F72|nr:uncharacterized protein J4E87_010338 [Alternaria ethzedia]KAI4612148.1 hypothetical protein J4E87_010338 [Alternaria ethzedia]